MSNSAVNPFEHDADRHAIWEMLMRRDFQAFVAGDWSQIAEDFDEPMFFGVSANHSPNVDLWSPSLASIEAYKNEWIRQAEEFKHIELVEDKLAFFFRAVHLRDIEITGDRAVAHKKFSGVTRTTTGDEINLNWQTLYKLIKRGDAWKIAGFVGYMPYPMPTGAVTSPAASASSSAKPFYTPEVTEQHRKAGPYSPVLTVEPGRIVVIAGQGPLNMDGDIVGETIEEQAELTIEHCKTQLERAGATLADVFKVMVYLDDMEEWGRFNEVYKKHMSDPYPVRTAIGCELWGGIKCEIDMMARIK